MDWQPNAPAPDFTQDSTEGPLHFYDWSGDSWVVLFSHPKDYTPACTTELGEVARLKPEFDKRGVKALGLYVDPTDSHFGWSKDIADTQGHAPNLPLPADAARKLSDPYSMIHPTRPDVRGGGQECLRTGTSGGA